MEAFMLATGSRLEKRCPYDVVAEKAANDDSEKKCSPEGTPDESRARRRSYQT
jgi:hypothetical protein